MKFSCFRNDLNDALSIVQRGIMYNSKVEPLQCIKIEANKIDGTLKLFSYNLEIGILKTIKAKIELSGSILVKSIFIKDVTKKLPDSEISMFIEKNTVIIQCGKCQFKTQGFSISDFPNFPEVNYKYSFTISEKILKDMLTRTLFAVALNDIRIFTTGILFEMKNNYLRLVSLDGCRLSMRSEIVENSNFKYSCIVPGKSLKEICHIIEDIDSNINVRISEKYIAFQKNNLMIFSRLLEDNFFNYENVIHKKNKYVVKLNAASLYESIERASLIINSTKMTPCVKLKFNFDLLSINCSDNNSSYNDEISISSNLNKFTIAFNIKYLLDALKHCKNEDIILELETPLLPLIIKPVNKSNFLFMVVPVRIDENSEKG